MDRRTLLRVLPAIAPLIAAESGLHAQEPRRAPADQPPAQLPRINKEQLEHALALLGLEFPAEQRDIMLPVVNRALGNYEDLRKIAVPLDTEPAFRFFPALPGKKLPGGRAQFVPTRVRRAPKRPASIEELAFSSAGELGRLLRARQVTSVELTKMYLERLNRHSEKLLCVVTLTDKLALEQAERADSEIKRGKHRGPLHGVPFGAKDLFATKGVPATWGAEPFQNQIFDYDATVIERMDKAGAVLLAKLSMGALAQGGLWFRGMTKTPWNLEQTSSGSSAGSASATAAGLVGFSLGTETLGSIISPSTRCGTAGLRPTYGRISRYGAMGLSWTMDKIGPICRTVEDCALVLNAAYGPDQRDGTVLDVPFNFNAQSPIGKLKIGYTKADFDRQEGDRKKMYDQVLVDLKRAGANLEPVELPAMQTQALLILLTAEAATAFDDITRDGRVTQLRGQAANDWPNTFRSARVIPAVEYIRAQRARTLLMQQMDELMSKWDVIVSPTFGSSLSITNLTGHPQVVTPCGFIDKMPQSVLFAGRLYEEGTPLRVAMAYEQSTDWHTMHPPLFV